MLPILQIISKLLFYLATMILILDPEIRWFPADEALREQGYEKLLPPFVPEIRKSPLP